MVAIPGKDGCDWRFCWSYHTFSILHNTFLYIIRKFGELFVSNRIFVWNKRKVHPLVKGSYLPGWADYCPNFGSHPLLSRVSNAGYQLSLLLLCVLALFCFTYEPLLYGRFCRMHVWHVIERVKKGKNVKWKSMTTFYHSI